VDADRELDAAEADFALARGRVMHARFLLRRDIAGASAAQRISQQVSQARAELFSRH
jgi:hypothetical protein